MEGIYLENAYSLLILDTKFVSSVVLGMEGIYLENAYSLLI